MLNTVLILTKSRGNIFLFGGRCGLACRSVLCAPEPGTTVLRIKGNAVRRKLRTSFRRTVVYAGTPSERV